LLQLSQSVLLLSPELLHLLPVPEGLALASFLFAHLLLGQLIPFLFTLADQLGLESLFFLFVTFPEKFLLSFHLLDFENFLLFFLF
jgi:hypothetical protein